jgi:uncharacterized protein (TIGR02145 family)
MKYKIILWGLLFTAGLGFTLLNSYSQENKFSGEKTSTTRTVRNTADHGVEINGVKWATRNVDVSGTFTVKPGDAGMLYQWNRITAWLAIGNEVADWDTVIPEGNTWDVLTDPSPKGWRVPNYAEVQTLFDVNRVTNEWVVIDSLTAGRKFTDKFTGNSLFLPVTGYRNDNHGVLVSRETHGFYWCSTKLDSINAYGFRISDTFSGTTNEPRGEAKAIRCVAE